MKADEVNAAMGKFLSGEKPSNQEEADALTRAVELVLWEAAIPSGPRAQATPRRAWTGRFGWLRFGRQPRRSG
jgi:hypothetical protein